MAEVKWIKIVTDIFDDEKMLLIDGLPESDGIIVIWFKLLCMAGKQNNGGVLMLNDKIAYTDEMLATIFRRKLNIVRLALETFERFGMIEIVDNAITIPNWEKHQSLDKLERVREQGRKRVAEHRKKQKLIASSNCNADCNVTEALQEEPCNGDVTESNADRLDKDIDKNKNINIDLEIYKEIISYLNEKAGTNYRSSSKTTRQHIHARLEEGYSVEDFQRVIDNKCADWKGTEWEKYLRPTTLFGTKFESYLNQKQTKKGANGIPIAETSEPDILDAIL